MHASALSQRLPDTHALIRVLYVTEFGCKCCCISSTSQRLALHSPCLADAEIAALKVTDVHCMLKRLTSSKSTRPCCHLWPLSQLLIAALHDMTWLRSPELCSWVKIACTFCQRPTLPKLLITTLKSITSGGQLSCKSCSALSSCEARPQAFAAALTTTSLF